jgi:hypothetical protein
LLQKKQNSDKHNAKNNAKRNANATKALLEKKIAEHVEHRKRGVGIDQISTH